MAAELLCNNRVSGETMVLMQWHSSPVEAPIMLCCPQTGCLTTHRPTLLYHLLPNSFLIAFKRWLLTSPANYVKDLISELEKGLFV